MGKLSDRTPIYMSAELKLVCGTRTNAEQFCLALAQSNSCPKRLCWHCEECEANYTHLNLGACGYARTPWPASRKVLNSGSRQRPPLNYITLFTRKSMPSLLDSNQHWYQEKLSRGQKEPQKPLPCLRATDSEARELQQPSCRVLKQSAKQGFFSGQQ